MYIICLFYKRPTKLSLAFPQKSCTPSKPLNCIINIDMTDFNSSKVKKCLFLFPVDLSSMLLIITSPHLGIRNALFPTIFPIQKKKKVLFIIYTNTNTYVYIYIYIPFESRI